MHKKFLLLGLLLALTLFLIPLANAQGGPSAITDAELNVRQGPGLSYATIGTLDYDSAIVLEGRDSSGEWVLMLHPASGLRGWVSAAWLRDLSAPLSTLPLLNPEGVTVSAAESAPLPTGNSATVNAELNLRVGPGLSNQVVLILAPRSQVVLIGRDYSNDWVEVQTLDSGTQGWVAVGWLSLPQGLRVEDLPLTGEEPDYSAAAAPSDVQTDIAISSGTLNNARQIFALGQGRGNNRNTFIRVGDSNSVGGAFLCNFQYGRYELGDYAFLAPTITLFQSSFSLCAADVSVRNGFSSYTLLDPLWTNPSRCELDESPLDCAIRRRSPAVAIIYLGLNDMSSLRPDDFRAAMNRLVDRLIVNGVIPVLNTFPISDRVAYYDPSFNSVIREIAASKQVPLIDLEFAARSLPNNGTGPDGYHLSCSICDFTDFSSDQFSSGRALRDLLTLQVLDILRREVLGG